MRRTRHSGEHCDHQPEKEERGDGTLTLNSLVFIFLFLPVSYLLCRFVRGTAGNIILVLLSIIFYSWGNPVYSVLLILSVVLTWAGGLTVAGLKKDWADRWALIALIVNAGILTAVLAAFKYIGTAGLPVGISFYTFSALSYLFDVYRDEEEPVGNPLDLALYIMLFTKILSGPIVRYKDMKPQLNHHPMTRESSLAGLEMFLTGLFKKVLLADVLGKGFSEITAGRLTVGTAWLGVLFYGLQLYFDFSGYSDMAIGLSRMFGFRIEKNFDYPYLSTSISEFWRRWHISLGMWFRNYVYIPLGGNRCSTLMQVRNLAAVWILTGIWHGSTWNYVLWGIWHGSFVILEKFLLGKERKLPAPVGLLITDLIALTGWIFFFTPTAGKAFGWFGALIGIGTAGVWKAGMGFVLRNYLLTLVIAIIACTPFLRNLHERLTFRGRAWRVWISAAMYGILFLFSIASILGSTYTTFLYAQF